MKVLFLDIDGVLNDVNTTFRNYLDNKLNIDEGKVGLLKEIIDATGAKIVLSSTWRAYGIMKDGVYIPKTPEMIELVDLFKSYGLEIYDITPSFIIENKGLEIKTWLRRYDDIESFVILDDEDNTLKEFVGNELVKTQFNNSDVILEPDYGTGLCRKHVKIVIDKLNGKVKKRGEIK